MKTHLKILISAAFSLLSLDILTRFFQWMNRSSDAWFYAGALGSLLVLVFAPVVVVAIWRDRIPGFKQP